MYLAIVFCCLFLILLVIVAHLLLTRTELRNLSKSAKEKSEIEINNEIIKQLKNELKKDSNSKEEKSPVLDILIKHKKTNKIINTQNNIHKSEFSQKTPLKLSELQEELEVVKRDVSDEENVIADEISLTSTKDQKEIEEIISDNINSDETILNQNKYFKLNSGKFIKNIPELVFTIENITQKEFDGYVNAKNNDFAEWIEDTLKNPELAYELRKDISKKHHLFVLNKFL
jgi:hypothetical protein